MSTVPARPKTHTDKWVVVFEYFDKLTTGSGLSQPTPFKTQGAATKAAGAAQGKHNGGGIKVQVAYVYPPANVEADVQVVNFT